MRVLIAEDEPLEAEALRARLHALGHTVVGVVHSGGEAVESVSILRPDLVFLDLRMPGLDGITAAEKILAEKWLPIIMVSGLGDAALADRLAMIGVVGLLAKPVDRTDLEKAIALAVDRCRQEENRKRP